MTREYNAFENFVDGAYDNLVDGDKIAAAYYIGRADHMRSRRDKEWSALSEAKKEKLGQALNTMMMALDLPL